MAAVLSPVRPDMLTCEVLTAVALLQAPVDVAPEVGKSSKDVLETMDNAKISAFHFKVRGKPLSRLLGRFSSLWSERRDVTGRLRCAPPLRLKALTNSSLRLAQAIVVAGMCVSRQRWVAGRPPAPWTAQTVPAASLSGGTMPLQAPAD